MYYSAILLVMNKKVEIMKWWTCDHFVSSHHLNQHGQTVTMMMCNLSVMQAVLLALPHLDDL